MYTTVIFDLDGTLLDTLDDLTAAVNHALTCFSLPTRTREEVRSFVGNGIDNLMKRASAEKCPDFEGMMTAFRTFYGAHCKDKTKPYAGVLELLQTLKSRGVLAAVVSNKADFAVKMLAKEYFPDLLSEAVGENEAEGVRRKPAPDSLLAVMERLNAQHESTVYVGDSEVDIQTAKNAEVDCISVVWGFKDKEFLQKNGGKVFVETPLDILPFCGGK